jgi:hypothetical protein
MNLNNIQIYREIVKQRLQNVSIKFQTQNPNDDFQLNDMQESVKTPRLKRQSLLLHEIHEILSQNKNKMYMSHLIW